MTTAEYLSRWVPFPNFSFEIVRHRDGANGGGGVGFAVTPEMVQQVWEVFPQYSAESIQSDLMHTRSPERTIERILNGSFETRRQQQDANGSDMGEIAQAIENIDEELRWSLSALWSNLWRAQPVNRNHNHNGTEHVALSDNHLNGNGELNAGQGDLDAAETLLRQLERLRREQR